MPPAAPASATTQYTYDKAGNMIKLVDPVGNTTNFAYNGASQETAMTQILGTNTSSFVYSYNQASQLISTLNQNGGTETYANDAADRILTEVWYNSASAAVETIAFSYDQAGNMLTASNSVSGDSFSYSFAYNGAGQATSVIEPFATLGFGYDLAGNRISVSDSLGGTETLGYDGASNLTALTYSDMSSNALSFNFVFDYAGQATQEDVFRRLAHRHGCRQLRRGKATSPTLQPRILLPVPRSTVSATLTTWRPAYHVAGFCQRSFNYTYDGGQAIEGTAGSIKLQLRRGRQSDRRCDYRQSAQHLYRSGDRRHAQLHLRQSREHDVEDTDERLLGYAGMGLRL